MQDLREISRRQILRTGIALSGVAIAGCNQDRNTTDLTASDRTQTASPTRTRAQMTVEQYTFAAKADYWAWFPSDRELWSRSADPYDFRQGGKRWLAGPTSDGSIRCRVENDTQPGNAGFYVSLGPLGDVGSIAVETETVRSDGTEPQHLLFGLYADVNSDGGYFDWTAHESREAFTGFGGDAEAIGRFPAGGTFTIADDTEVTLISADGSNTTTLAELKRGTTEGIGPQTRVAVQISVQGSGDGNTEEAIVHGMSIDGMRTLSSAWPMVAHDARNTGRAPSASGPRDAVETRWTFETEGSVRSSPVLARDTVYVGSDDGNLYALHASTGEKKWAYRTDGAIEAAPAHLGRMVYVGSTDGQIYALTETGKTVWTFETGGPIRSSPTVEASSSGEGLDDLLVVGSDDGSVYFLNALTGDPIKTIDTDGPVRATPLVYVERHGFWEGGVGSADGNIYYWLPSYQGGQVNVVDIGAPVFAPVSVPDVSGQNVWYRANDDGVLSKQVRTTNPRWTFEAGGKIRTAPVLAGELVFVGSWDGNVYGVNVEDGTERWAFETGGIVDAAPAIANGTLYLGSSDQSVYALDATSGTALWTYETGGEVVSSPAVVDNTVYVGSNDGTVYALTAPSE